ncbi:MAG: chorismate synthase [Candidatus Omnitrophica bacterium]|nr:chorismate synthase [Candidatus Omnitrophota bacterium]MCF7894074.1 chorismate synthase [Candidatus Omnitrophota bacterium]
MRFLTAGESHGKALTVILEGFPKGVRITDTAINSELEKRMQGPGRGGRMQIEKDKVEILSGLRNKITLGSPIAMVIKNKDAKINPQNKDSLEEKNVARPAHADLAGSLKYNEKDINNILERASARETAARVCVGSVCKQFLATFKTRVVSYIKQIGSYQTNKTPKDIDFIFKKTKKSKVKTLDKKDQQEMLKQIEQAKEKKDSLGGIIEIWAAPVPVGLGTFMQFDQRVDAKLAQYLMSIPAVKGVEIGAGFSYADKRGSQSHDAIYYSKDKGYYHKTNNSGGIEAGISNGEPIVIRIAMKPIATLAKPLDSVNLKTKRKQKASLIRSDTSAVVACSVVAETMCAIALTESFLDKFGSDSLAQIISNYKNYIKTIY